MNVNGKEEKPINRRSDNMSDMRANRSFPKKTYNNGEGWMPNMRDDENDPRLKKRTR